MVRYGHAPPSLLVRQCDVTPTAELRTPKRCWTGAAAGVFTEAAVQDEMFLAAARALADFVTPEQIENGQLYPEAKDLRKVAATVRVLSCRSLLVPPSQAFGVSSCRLRSLCTI